MRTTIQGSQLPEKGFDEPFEMLVACHQRLARMLALLQRMRTHLRAQGADEEARQAARDIARYFDMAAPQHHRDEELHVFPPLLAGGDDEITAAVRRLQAEHEQMEATWAEAGPLLHELAAGERHALAPEDESRLEAFAALYASHVAAEESLAYPRAQALLDATALSTMGQEMKARRGG